MFIYIFIHQVQSAKKHDKPFRQCDLSLFEVEQRTRKKV